MQRKQKTIIIAMVVMILALAAAVTGLLYERNSISKQQAIDIAYGQAVKYCLKNSFTPSECKKVKLDSIDEVWNGPTDGSDEYVGAWLIDFSSSEIGSKFYTKVSLGYTGNIEYVNSGELEYPVKTKK